MKRPLMLWLIATALLVTLFGLIDVLGGDMSWSTAILAVGGVSAINLVLQVLIWRALKVMDG